MISKYNFLRCWKENSCSIRKSKSAPKHHQENIYLGEYTSWSRNEYCLWHEAKYARWQRTLSPIAHSHCSLKLTSSILMFLRAKFPLTPNLMLSPFHSNFLLSLRLNRYVLALGHLFRINGYWWIVYPEEQCKLNFPFWVCKEVILKFWSEIYSFGWQHHQSVILNSHQKQLCDKRVRWLLRNSRCEYKRCFLFEKAPWYFLEHLCLCQGPWFTNKKTISGLNVESRFIQWPGA